MKKENVSQLILNHFRSNPTDFEFCFELFSNVTGKHTAGVYHNMEDLDSIVGDVPAVVLLDMALNGRDEGHGKPFCTDRPFFRIDTDGNLVSAEKKDYSFYLVKYTVYRMAKVWKDNFNAFQGTEIDRLFNEFINAD